MALLNEGIQKHINKKTVETSAKELGWKLLRVVSFL
jgi:hypothetical protein